MRTPKRSAPRWLLDELGSAGRENLDESHVSRYDSIEDAGSDAEVSLLKGLGLGRQSVVVEIGAGTGQFSLAVAEHCDRVVAVDISPPMLMVLAAKAIDVPNLQIVHSGFLTYEHEGPLADIVYTRYAMHHLPDFWKGIALARIHSMLKPGGLLRVWDVVYNFEPHEALASLNAWCASAPEGATDQWSRADYEEHVKDEHSTYTWTFETMADRTGFAIEQAEYSEDGIFAKYVFTRRGTAASDPL